jgi:trans-aconitate 2-methyltransferase
MWDPGVYHRYGSERARPYFDLIAQVGADQPGTVADLGCGPGELTGALAGRWPGATIVGVDSSPEMIAKARTLGLPVDFRIGDVRDWHPGPEVGVVVTNATLQWVPEHRELLTRWATGLRPGAWIAMQVPGNFDAPSHRALREVAHSAPFEAAVGHVVRADPVDDAAGYAARLTGVGAEVNAWETTYVHLLQAGDGNPVLRWMEGTALRPVRAALDDSAWQRFRAVLGAKLAAAYPVRGGLVPFEFRRVFVVAKTAQEKP